jgi:hypothetical protein
LRDDTINRCKDFRSKNISVNGKKRGNHPQKKGKTILNSGFNNSDCDAHIRDLQ